LLIGLAFWPGPLAGGGIGAHRFVALLGSLGIEPQFATANWVPMAPAAIWPPLLLLASTTSVLTWLEPNLTLLAGLFVVRMLDPFSDTTWLQPAPPIVASSQVAGLLPLAPVGWVSM